MNLPSPSNTTGTVLGGLAGAIIAASAPSWPFVISAAALVGMTPVGLAGVLALGVTSIVNLLATHVAQVKNLDGLVSSWWPVISVAMAVKTSSRPKDFPDVPPGENLPVGTTNTNLTVGKMAEPKP